MKNLLFLSQFQIGLLWLLILSISILQGISFFYYIACHGKKKLTISFYALLWIYCFYAAWSLLMIEASFTDGILYLCYSQNKGFVLLVLGFSLWQYIRSKDKSFIWMGLILIAQLDAWANLAPKAFPILYGISWFGMGLWVLRHLSKNHRFSKQSINALSLKDAIDKLPVGLCVAGHGGQIFLINALMARLLRHELKIFSLDIHQTWQQILDQTKDEKNSKEVFLTTPSGQSYHLKWQTPLTIQKGYPYISAKEITREMALIEQLSKENARLENSAHQLQSALLAIEAAEKEKVLSESRIKLHDVLAQKISLLHYYLAHAEKNSPQAMKEIRHILNHLPQELYSDPKNTPTQWKEALCLTLKNIGIHIEFQGNLPSDPHMAFALIHIFREGATNAIRHGNATRIWAKIKTYKDKILFTIENNGALPNDTISEGRGIRGIRHLLSEIGGTLKIKTEPHFQLRIHIPLALEKEPPPVKPPDSVS